MNLEKYSGTSWASRIHVQMYCFLVGGTGNWYSESEAHNVIFLTCTVFSNSLREACALRTSADFKASIK